MANTLIDVATYQPSALGQLQNENYYISAANKKFLNFQNMTANLGDTVTFDLPPRFIAEDGLVLGANAFQDATQRVHSLTVDQPKHVSYAFTAQERIFNVKEYMEKFGNAAMAELGQAIETNVALNNINNTYRATGDGVTDISSHVQLAQAVANFRNYGAANGQICGVIPDTKIPAIVNSGLQQFTLNRGNKESLDWELSDYSGASWYSSNNLPTHEAGTVGNQAQTLTVVSINAAGTQLTLSGASNSDSNAIKSGDILTFNDGVSGQTNVRFLKWTGHTPSTQKVQVRATADAASNGSGNVTVNIFPALVDTSPLVATSNVTTPIVAGMELSVLPNHIAGLLYTKPALFLAMPQLPDESPFITANSIDMETGASLRMYYGSKFGENVRGLVHDQIWGSTLVPEYAMRLIFTV